MRATSTVPAFRAMADLPSAQRRRTAWSAYEADAAEAFSVYFGGWASRAAVPAAADAAPDLLDGLEEREARALSAARAAELVLRDAGLLEAGPDDDLDVVLLVGVGASNGWVAPLHGRPTLFLALELLPPTPYDVVLAVHEAVHLAVERRRPDAPWPDGLVQAVVDEGLATVLSRRLVPGLAESAYLWFDDDHGEWVRACEVAAAGLRLRALTALTDDASADDLFLMGRGGAAPERGGYWLADRVMTQVLSTHGLDDVIGWTHSDATAIVSRALEGPPRVAPT